MNNRDRENIANILSGIANSEPSSFLNAGCRILRSHQKIVDMLEPHELSYWNVMTAGEPFKHAEGEDDHT